MSKVTWVCSSIDQGNFAAHLCHSQRTHHTFLDFHPTRMEGKLEQGIIVPQKVYTPAYCEYGWKPHSPITFVFDGRPGVNLAEAQDWKLEGSDLPLRVRPLAEANRMWTLSDKQQVQIRILVSTL